MTKQISMSAERHSFQRNGYLERCASNNTEPNQNYLDLFENILAQQKNKWSDPESIVNNLEYDLVTTDWILEKVRASESYAQNLYAALANNSFMKLDVVTILKDIHWNCSWRHAGGIVADMRQQGDYIDWYCSGIGSAETGYGLSYKTGDGYVSESVVTDEIENDLRTLGWAVVIDHTDNDSI